MHLESIKDALRMHFGISGYVFCLICICGAGLFVASFLCDKVVLVDNGCA